MPRRTWRRGGYSRREGRSVTNPPTEATLFIAVVLWLIGVASTLLGVIHLPGNWGLIVLAAAGLLLILASVIYGL
jgi:hypothetical protein